MFFSLTKNISIYTAFWSKKQSLNLSIAVVTILVLGKRCNAADTSRIDTQCDYLIVLRNISRYVFQMSLAFNQVKLFGLN